MQLKPPQGSLRPARPTCTLTPRLSVINGAAGRWQWAPPPLCTGVEQRRPRSFVTLPLPPCPCFWAACRINAFLDGVDVGDLIVKGDLEAYSCACRPLSRQHSAGRCAPDPLCCARVLSLAAASGTNAPEHQQVRPVRLCPAGLPGAPPSSRRLPPARPPPAAGKLAGLDKKLSRSLEEEVAAGSASPSSLSKSPVGPLQESSSRKTLVYLILTLNHIYPDYDFSLLRAHHFRKEEGVSAVEELIDAHLVEASKVGAKCARCTPPAANGGGCPPCPQPLVCGSRGCRSRPGGLQQARGPLRQSHRHQRRGPQDACSFPLGVPKVWETTPGFGEEPLLDNLWSSIDEAICLKECDVYRCGACPALPRILVLPTCCLMLAFQTGSDLVLHSIAGQHRW